MLEKKSANISRADTERQRLTFDTLRWQREDSRFINAWGARAGLHESGGSVKGEATISRLAFQTMRQYQLTAAGKDIQWYSIKTPGKSVAHVPANAFIYIDGEVYTAESLFNA